MKLIKDLIPEGLPCDTKEKFAEGQPSIITIHWIGPYPHQSVHDVRNWWIVSKGEASAHYVVKDDVVLQCWENDKVAWHAGCKSGNYSSIGIEVCPDDHAGKFSDKTIQTLKELLETLPRLPIVRHYDWTKKDCPRYYCDNEKWEQLLKELGR